MLKILVLFVTLIFIGEAAPSKEIWKIGLEDDPNLFEGDIVLTPQQEFNLRNGIIDKNYRWPHATMAYKLDQKYTSKEKQKIQLAWEEISNLTCIKFKKKTYQDKNYVYVKKGSGCSSYVGRLNEGKQIMQLSKNCISHGIIIHKMVHALGFWHEQSRHDRDDFVSIIWENIEPAYEHNFKKYSENTTTTFGVPYDYNSIMHYPATAFSKNGMPTIVPKKSDVEIGLGDHLTKNDVQKLRLMYKC